ncbi:MAG: hypothetical protein R2775_11285 [Flavobacteriaceae bacterium]
MKNTKAFHRFTIHSSRTERLIKLGGIGIDQEKEQLEEILFKFRNVKGKPGKIPADFEPEISVENDKDEKTLELTVDERTAFVLKQALEFTRSSTEELHNHLFSIYLVYMWGAFETYILMMFEELFEKKPEMLQTNEKISYSDLIKNKSDVLGFVIDNELEKIGHFSLDKYVAYLDDKINYKITKANNTKLEQIYLLRNIVAHNTGIVSNRLKSKIPKALKVKEGELFITKKYLETEMKTIVKIVTDIENHVQKKFGKNVA